MNVSINIDSPSLGVVEALGLIGLFSVAIIHIVFTIVIYRDAKEHGSRLVWPSIWALVALLFGPLGAATYWIICRLSTNTVTYP